LKAAGESMRHVRSWVMMVPAWIVVSSNYVKL